MIHRAIKIGTRALISVAGKPLLATHWDGYPSCLGLKLLDCNKTKAAIVDAAKEMDTSTLKAFRDYVQKGGRLVWISDAGTGLGENDYICEQVEFAYLPAADYTVPIDDYSVLILPAIDKFHRAFLEGFEGSYWTCRIRSAISNIPESPDKGCQHVIIAVRIQFFLDWI